MNAPKVHLPSRRDQRLRYTMRVMGFAIVLFSTFLLMKSITLDPVVNGFFALSAGLGFGILVAGWIPSREPQARTTTTYRKSARFERPAGVASPVFQPVAKHPR